LDAYRGEAEEYNLLDFSLFVMYFPQLIAGPMCITRRYSAVSPGIDLRLSPGGLAAGLTLFTIGLVKKV